MDCIKMVGRFEFTKDVRAFYLAVAHHSGDWLITNVNVTIKEGMFGDNASVVFDVCKSGATETHCDIKMWMKEFLKSIREFEEQLPRGVECHVFIQSCKPYVEGDPDMWERSNYFFPEYV